MVSLHQRLVWTLKILSLLIWQDYSPHFVFDVPLDHPEIVRLSKEASGDGAEPQQGDASSLQLKEG